MHQRGDVNEFNDHGEIDMPGIDLACGAAGEQSQQRAKAFTRGCRPRRRRNLRLRDRMPRPVARCASRLAQDAVELILQLQPNEARESCSPSQLRGDSCSGPCGRRVPRGENSGAGCRLSKQHNADPARILWRLTRSLPLTRSDDRPSMSLGSRRLHSVSRNRRR